MLRPGGRLVVSDMVAKAELPEEIRGNPDLWAGCVAGALPEEEYLETIRQAGFAPVEALTRQGRESAHVYSVAVRAGKPGGVNP